MKKNNQKSMKDTVSDGKLQVSPLFVKVAPNNSAICDNFATIGEFHSGDVEVWRDSGGSGRNSSEKLSSVQCLRLRIGSGQRSWIILREIQIFV